MPKDPNLDGEGLSLGLDYPRVKITCHVDVTVCLTIELPFHRGHIIWNNILDDSFQVVVVALDVMQRVFTGSQFTKTLAMVEFDFTGTVINYKPQWDDWKKVEPGLYDQL